MIRTRRDIRNLLARGYQWKIIGSRTGPPNILTANTGTVGGGTASQYQSKSWYPLFGLSECKAIMFEYANFYNSAGPQTVDAGPFDATLTAGVQDPNGKIISLQWQRSGSASILQAQADATNGQTDLSIPMPCEIDPSTPFLLMREFRSYAGVPGFWPNTMVGQLRGDEAVEFGTALTDKTTPGSANFFGSGNSRTFSTLLAIWGLVPRDFFIPIMGDFGDSISSTGNVDSDHIINGGHWEGWFYRLFGWYCPVVHIGASGWAVSSLNGAAERNRHIGFLINKDPNLFQAMTCLAITELGNSVKNAQTQANYKGAVDNIRKWFLPFKPMTMLCPGPPLTDATNTTFNATYGAASWTNIAAICNWMDTNPYNSPTIEMDVRHLVGDSSNSYLLWNSNGLYNGADGNHMQPAGHDLVVSTYSGLQAAAVGTCPN